MGDFVTITIDGILYPYVAFIAAIASFECLLIGFFAGGKRGSLFNAEFMQQFSKEHKEVTGNDI